MSDAKDPTLAASHLRRRCDTLGECIGIVYKQNRVSADHIIRLEDRIKTLENKVKELERQNEMHKASLNPLESWVCKRLDNLFNINKKAFFNINRDFRDL